LSNAEKGLLMPIKVLINGAFGRMGQATVKAINDDKKFELVGQTGRAYDLKKAIKDSQAEVVVDFTHPDTVFATVNEIMDTGAHPVIGTSGLTREQVQTLKARAAQLKLGGIIAPNFSLGAVLMMKCAKDIAAYLPHVEIIEMHHDSKADSPSATALLSAEILTEANAMLNQPVKTIRETLVGARGATYQRIPIHAVRLPGLLAHQQIIFGSKGETLTLKHDSIDRECFMPGVCLACEKVVTLDRLVYGLDKIL
jgi:4-hydroxy-tetrahydrodipicolinate reductase